MIRPIAHFQLVAAIYEPVCFSVALDTLYSNQMQSTHCYRFVNNFDGDQSKGIS